MNTPAIIAIAFTILAVPLWLKAAFAKPTPRQDEDINLIQGGALVARQAHNLKAAGSIPAPGSISDSPSVNGDGCSPAPVEALDKSQSIWNPATSRWEIAMAELEEQKESYYED